MFCNKCGNELDVYAAFCNMCGTPVEKDDHLFEMSAEESIELVDKLKTRYSQVEKLEREVADNERRINGPLNLETRRYSFFRFYWKFLVFAVIAFYFFLFFSLVMMDSESYGVPLALTFIVPIAILITGIFFAIRNRNIENDAIESGNQIVMQQRRTLEKKNEELKKTLYTRKRDLDQINDMVPEEFRKSSSLAQAKTLLTSGKASTLPEAFRMLKR